MIVQQFDLTHSSLFVVVVAFNTEFNVGFHAISIKADDCGQIMFRVESNILGELTMIFYSPIIVGLVRH